MPAQENAIFISYRRSQSNDVTGRICDRLKAHFGDEAVFIDYEDIPYGVDFPNHLQRTVNSATVLLAVIGPTWLNVLKERMDKPKTDWVRAEVECALVQKLTVIPVIVGEAKIPEVNDLPSGLLELSSLNAPKVRSGIDFEADIKRLIQQLAEKVDQASTTVTLSRFAQLELSRLRDELKDRERDYRTVAKDLKVELDGVTQNKLRDSLSMIGEEMDAIEKQIAEIAQSHGKK